MATSASSGYLRPGGYVGPAITPAAPSISGFPRLPCFVARGSRYIEYKNSEITRAKVEDESLTFTGNGPYSAVLDFQSNGDKDDTTLVTSDGEELTGDKWVFAKTVVDNDTIKILSQHYDQNVTYSVTYQSIDRDVLDPMPFEDARIVQKVGRGKDADNFTEATDFELPVTVGAPTSDSGNANTDTESYGTTNGNTAKVVLAGPSSDTITLVASTAGEAGGGIRIVTVDGGTSSLDVTETLASKLITITFDADTDTTATIEDAITAAIGDSSVTLLASATDSGTATWTASQVQTVYTTTIDTTAAVSSAAIFFAPTTSEYSGLYDRDYVLTCTGSGDADTATFVWSSSPNSLGNSMAPRSPYHSALDTGALENSLDTPGNTADITLEYGLKLNFKDNSGALNYISGATWTFRVFGAGLIEKDARHDNTNQFVSVGAVTDIGSPTGDGLSVDSSTDYSGTYNRTYYLVCSAISAGVSATFHWTAVGDDGISYGVTTALTDTDTATLDNGVVLVVDLANDFAVGDKFSVTVKAPKVTPTFKDDRTYSIEVDSSPVTGSVAFLYAADTPEGGTGTFTATTADPHIEFDGNLTLHVRNLIQPRYDAGDDYTCAITLDDTIDWSLLVEVAESVDEDDIIKDTLGRITGTAGNYYIILKNVPTSIQSITKDTDDSEIASSSYSIVTDTDGDNTAYIDLGSTDPGDDITVTYRHKGSEPNPGETYRVSALYLRDDSLYNKPTLIQSKEDGVALVGPMSSTNHAAVINDIAWKIEPTGFYLCQVADADLDGVFQDSDYETAVEATEGTKRITDLVVLDGWGSLNTQISSLDKLANPLLKKSRMGWFGAPNDTEVGDADTSGSLVYTAASTMAVYGTNPAHGTRVMVAPTECDYTVKYSSGRTQAVTFDGSFVAAAMCLQYAAFAEPWMTILKKNLTVFDSIQTYTEDEEDVLGLHQINFLSDQGESVYRWEEDVTVDKSGTVNAPDEFKIISAMIQKKFIIDNVHNAIDSAVISVVPDSPEQGVQIIRNVVSGTLESMVALSKIGRYQDEDGNIREFSPNTDILVFRVTGSSTEFKMKFGYFLRYPIKYVFGEAFTDTADFRVAA